MILATRARQARNLLATVFLAQGVPMLMAGDEFGRTQQGNNNAYCQDNEINWIDWTLAERNAPLIAFVRRLIDLRKSRLWLRRDTFLKGTRRGADTRDVTWLRDRRKCIDPFTRPAIPAGPCFVAAAQAASRPREWPWRAAVVRDWCRTARPRPSLRVRPATSSAPA